MRLLTASKLRNQRHRCEPVVVPKSQLIFATSQSRSSRVRKIHLLPRYTARAFCILLRQARHEQRSDSAKRQSFDQPGFSKNKCADKTVTAGLLHFDFFDASDPAALDIVDHPTNEVFSADPP